MKRFLTGAAIILMLGFFIFTDLILMDIAFREEILGRFYLPWLAGLHAAVTLLLLYLVVAIAYDSGHADAMRHFTQRRP